jgi:hypothetical protein
MTSTSLPAVLVPPAPYTGISMERALKQIKDLLEHHIELEDPSIADAVQASIDDVDVMLMCIV